MRVTNNTKTYMMIGKKLSGALSKKEELAFNQWLSCSPENRKMFQLQQEIWQVKERESNNEQQQRAYRRLVASIGDPALNPRPRTRGIRRFLPYAALISLIAFIVLYIIWNQEQSPSRPHPAMVEKITPSGQKSILHLSDGSVVTLNAESTLRYPERFSDEKRTLELVGEGYFEVAKDKKRPFEVKVGGLWVTALGTSFNINAYPNDATSEVALLEGKVKVSPVAQASKTLLLTQGEAVSYEREKQTLRKVSVEEAAVAWKKGILYFKDAAMGEVMLRLARWYAVEIEVEGAPASEWNYSGQFKKEYLNRVLQSMSYATEGFTFEIHDKKVLIKF